MSKRVVTSLMGVIAVFALALLGGCGSGSDSGSTDTGSSSSTAVESTSMTKAEWAQQAQQICAKETNKVAGVVRKAIASGSEVKVEIVLPPVESMHEGLVALGAPEGEEAQVEEFLNALEADLEKAQAHPSAKTTELASDFKQSGDLAREAGIGACGLG